MSTNLTRRKVAYGFSEPLIQIGIEPVVTKRNPTILDRAPIGTEWVNTESNDAFFLTSIVDNEATWVPLTNSGTSPDFVTDSGTAIPAANEIEILGGTNITTSGSGNTVTIDIDGSVGVANGGTGKASFTPYAVVAGGTTGTGPLQQVASLGVAGQVLTSLGAGALPIWDDIVISGAVDHAIQVGNASGGIGSIPVGITNQVLLGNTGADPSFGAVPNAALANSSITLNNGNNITVTGSPVSLGGAASIAVTGTTNHTIQVGNASGSLTSLALATNGQIPIGSNGANPVIAAITAGSGISVTNGAGSITIAATGGGGTLTSITGDTGGAQAGPAITLTMGASNASGTATFVGAANVITLTPTDSLNNTAWGEGSMGDGVITGIGNVCYGFQAGNEITSGNTNTCIGATAGASVTTSTNNTLVGYICFDALQTGSGSNTGIGVHAGANLSSGAYNTFLGSVAGGAYTNNESSNICIGYNTQGTVGEDNTMRIGKDTGTGLGEINQTFVAGIDGIVVTGAAVLVSTSDQLGVAASSKRFKTDIKDMGDASAALYKLRPVSFVWNKKSSKGLGSAPDTPQYGLIAEEAYEYVPHAVNLDKKGEPFNINYQDLIGMMINEIQRLNERISKLEGNNG